MAEKRYHTRTDGRRIRLTSEGEPYPPKSRPATADDIAMMLRQKDQNGQPAVQSPKDFVDTHSLGQWNPEDAQTENEKLISSSYWRALNAVGALAFGASRMTAECGSEVDWGTDGNLQERTNA